MLSLESSPAIREIAGIPLVQTTPRLAAIDLCVAANEAKREQGESVHLVNAYNVVLAADDISYSELLKSSSANLPDGRPLTWWKFKNNERLSQIRGPQLFEDVVDIGRDYKLRHFLLGGTTETLRLLELSLHDRFPGVDIVGSISPPFRPMTSEEIAQQDKAIGDSGAQIVWVGLGTPKQDWEVARIAASLPVICIAVGAAFDFSAGTKKAAPRWMSQLYLEWMFRLLSEPRRLWKRYLIGNSKFLLIFIRSIIRGRSDQTNDGRIRY